MPDKYYEWRRAVHECIESARERGEQVIEKVIPFPNNDVPEFLADFGEFERASRGRRIMVRSL